MDNIWLMKMMFDDNIARDAYQRPELRHIIFEEIDFTWPH